VSRRSSFLILHFIFHPPHQSVMRQPSSINRVEYSVPLPHQLEIGCIWSILLILSTWFPGLSNQTNEPTETHKLNHGKKSGWASESDGITLREEEIVSANMLICLVCIPRRGGLIKKRTGYIIGAIEIGNAHESVFEQF
jgi:hypothetical protein